MHNTSSGNSARKWTIIISIDLIILCGIIYFFGIIRPFNHANIQISGVYLEHPKNIPNLNLIDHYGNPFTKNQLKGHWTFIFFGFTHCPMICPTTLDALNKFNVLIQKQLPAKLMPMIVFITIDPERDTVARLYQFINSYNSNFIGARTDVSKTNMLEKQFSLSVSGRNENIVHNTDILLLNPLAQIQAYFLFPHKPELIASDYKKIVKLNEGMLT